MDGKLALILILFVVLPLGLLARSNAPYRVPRAGLGPGFLNLGVWPGRVYFMLRGPRTIDHAYVKMKDQNYKLQTVFSDKVVLAPKFLQELRMLPGNKLSALEATYESPLGIVHGIDTLKDRQSNDVARVQLTRSLKVMLPCLAEEADIAIAALLQDCHEEDGFARTNCSTFAFQLQLRTTARAFAGELLCRDPEWLRMINEYENANAATVAWLLPFPKSVRHFIRPLIPPSWSIQMIQRVVRSRLFQNLRSLDENIPTIFQHLSTNLKGLEQDTIVANFLILVSTAQRTTATAITQCLFDLCCMPEHASELRKEAERALNDNNGSWSMTMIKDLVRLDSFIKESHRMNPPNFLSFDRKVMTPITLSDGTTLPAGVMISMPSGPMAKDPAYYPSPNTFLPDRFVRSNSLSSPTSPTSSTFPTSPSSPSFNMNDQGRTSHEFSGIEPGNLLWGSGRYTCPGRWYASAVIKMTLAKILLGYDVKFEGDGRERPPNVYFDDVCMPNQKQEILLRRRG